MRLDAAHCYQALTARDPRFDGTFFVGVTTTGIYCRPVCPARTPRADRCRFFASAAAAERRGFRPCLRCRPELAPHGLSESPDDVLSASDVDVVRARARLAGERIASGALDHDALETLAQSLGVSERHLRRVVERELGASPIALAQTRRLLTAKQLLTDTTLPMSQVALASGFRSLRRFNALFRDRYRLAPGDLRRSAASAAPSAAPDMVRVSVGLRPPFDWPAMCAYLGARAIPGVECVLPGEPPRYWRSVRVSGRTGVIAIGASERAATLGVDVSLSLLPALVPLLARLRHLLDLDATPSVIAAHLGHDPLLADQVARAPGRRVPGTVDAFELAVRAVLGQQVSVRGATTLAGRLVSAVAEPLASGTSPLTHAPISPERLADAPLALVAGIGLPRARAACLVTLARTVADGALPALVDPLLAGADTRAFEREFTALPGIGRWTSQYVAMRALRSPDAFPDDDLALRKAAGGLTAARLRHLAERWRPWRAYAAMHLWASLA